MKLTCAKDIIAVAKARGFDVLVRPGPPPMPVLRVPAGTSRDMATPALLEALKAWRVEIMQELGSESTPAETAAPRLREWLWAAGNYYVEAPYVAAMPQYQDKHPWEAAWWRWQGEDEWRPLPEAGEALVENALALARQKGHPL
jgi:hypothetical protein